MRWWLAAAWVPGTALANPVMGGDFGGGDVVLADGDELIGAFTSVGSFVVPFGATVTVSSQVPLVVYADSIAIWGTLDGTGGGFLGGLGAPPSANLGEAGAGFSPGEGGEPGYCVHGGGGGGGGHGGLGGNGGNLLAPQTGFGGAQFGTIDRPEDHPMGSGGGGGGSDCYTVGGLGAAGGASMVLVANAVAIDGAVYADGADAPAEPSFYPGGGGGGSGGSVVVYAPQLSGVGQVTARGGRGGQGPVPSGGYSGGGGGGSGGRIKMVASVAPSLSTDVSGGERGLDQAVLEILSTDGADGSTYTGPFDTDLDGDGVVLVADNCPFVANASQDDGDGDGLGDACDACPVDATGDTDRDGACDSDDVCTGFDDSIDRDLDGVPDDCDPCPNDGPDDTDGDGVCDSDDVCSGDDRIDTDSDAVPDDCDLCPQADDPEQLDGDGDGVGDACDCAPDNALGAAGFVEVCDEVDNDCDEEVDEAGSDGETTWYADFDNDGHGDPGNTVVACAPPANYVDNPLDCDDSSSINGPFGTEFCDGLDNDCDGVVDPPELQCNGDDGGGGCGCATTTPPPGLGWVLLGWLAVRRVSPQRRPRGGS